LDSIHEYAAACRGLRILRAVRRAAERLLNLIKALFEPLAQKVALMGHDDELGRYQKYATFEKQVVCQALKEQGSREQDEGHCDNYS
jgi:hypothetical protein